MTREEFRRVWRHEWGGIVLDARTNKLQGAAASLWYDALMAKIDERIDRMYDMATKEPVQPPKEQTNGNTNGQQKAQQQRASGNLGGGSSPQARR